MRHVVQGHRVNLIENIIMYGMIIVSQVIKKTVSIFNYFFFSSWKGFKLSPHSYTTECDISLL